VYNIVGNSSYVPPDIFVQQSFPYSTYRHANFIRPFIRTQYMYSSFVSSVITEWNTSPNHIKHSSSITAFEHSLQCLYVEAHYHISNVAIHIALCICNMNIIKKQHTILC